MVTIYPEIVKAQSILFHMRMTKKYNREVVMQEDYAPLQTTKMVRAYLWRSGGKLFQ